MFPLTWPASAPWSLPAIFTGATPTVISPMRVVSWVPASTWATVTPCPHTGTPVSRPSLVVSSSLSRRRWWSRTGSPRNGGAASTPSSRSLFLLLPLGGCFVLVFWAVIPGACPSFTFTFRIQVAFPTRWFIPLFLLLSPKITGCPVMFIQLVSLSTWRKCGFSTLLFRVSSIRACRWPGPGSFLTFNLLLFLLVLFLLLFLLRGRRGGRARGGRLGGTAFLDNFSSIFVFWSAVLTHVINSDSLPTHLQADKKIIWTSWHLFTKELLLVCGIMYTKLQYLLQACSLIRSAPDF